jgi:hypothetical protein
MEFRNDENGNVMIVSAICLSILMGFLGLALDVGLLFRVRQNVQIAADAAATAAALDYLYNQSVSSAQTVGEAASAVNGYTNGNGGVSVAINLPPQSGPNQSNGFAEAIVTTPSSTNFMGLFGFARMTVAARAVAGSPAVGTGCIWLMSTSGTALDLQGAYDIEAPDCGIYVNSPSSDSIKVTGNGGTLDAAWIDVVGDSVGHSTKPTTITAGAAPRKSPWGNLTGPVTPTDCSSTSLLTSVTTSNESGISGSVVCFQNAVTLNTGVDLPGSSSGVVYVFENGLSLSGTVTFGSGTYNASTGTFTNTAGAVVDIAGGTLTQGNAILNIYAPTAGTYNGIAILQPESNSNDLQVQFGSGNEVLDGYIYAPGAEVYLQDHGGGIVATGIVAGSMYDKASTIRIPSYDDANSTTTPNRVITLVE